MAERTITRQVRLSALQAGSLQPGELEYALAYELEPESGIPAREAAATWRELESPDAAVRVFEVTVSRRANAAGARSAAAGETSWMPRAIRIAAVIAAAALVACAVDFVLVRHRNASLRRTIAMQEPLDAELKRLAQQERAARDEARAIQDAREAAERAQQNVETLRAALPGALDALAAVLGSSKSTATIVSFSSPRPFSLDVKAVAISATAAADTLAELTAAAHERGWALSPGDITSAPDGLTAAFSFQLDFIGR